MRKKSWDEAQLRTAVKLSSSVRAVIKSLGLVPAGGNYVQINKEIRRLKLNIDHFKGQGWSRGNSGGYNPLIPLSEILQRNTSFQSFKLKRRLFREKILKEKCSLCGWAKQSIDGRIPLELDHINGIRDDNRLKNLRVLCPNCHSLQPTHRGRNIKKNLGLWRNR